MRLERLHEYITSTTVIILGLFVAVLCGKMTANNENAMLSALVLSGILAFIALWLRERTWMLIPLAWMLTGFIPLLTVPLRVLDIVVLYVFGTYLVFTAVRVIRLKSKFESLDLLILANLIYLLSVFVRNPVGLSVFHTNLVGGRPYFNVFVASLAYSVLRSAPVSLKEARWLPNLMLAGAAIMSLAAAVSYYLPSLGYLLAHFYTGFSPGDPSDPATDVGDGGLDRRLGFSFIGITGMLWLSARFIPVTLFLPFFPLRFLAAAFFGLADLLSGYRSAVLMSGAYLALSSCFRRRYQDLFIMGAIVLFGLGMALVGNGTLFHLPLSVQRAVSFLPGNWDREATEDAQDSVTWRVEMWKMVMTEDKWIKDKWLGDGFGFSSTDLAIMQGQQTGGAGFLGGTIQEAQLISGAFHSGPLSTIRVVGGVGFVLFFWLMLALAVRAYRMIVRTRGTTFFPLALFVAMPIILTPANFTFVFGSFDGGFPDALLAAGMLRLLERVFAASQEPTDLALLPRQRHPKPLPVNRPQLVRGMGQGIPS